MDDHPSGNPKLVKQHKRIQRKGDQELAQGSVASEPTQRGEDKTDDDEGIVRDQK